LRLAFVRPFVSGFGLTVSFLVLVLRLVIVRLFVPGFGLTVSFFVVLRLAIVHSLKIRDHNTMLNTSPSNSHVV
jgi:hypothetical protein